MRRTKIVCTIGPSSRSPEALEKLVDAGMNVARLNFSHGTQEEHGRVIDSLRAIAARLDRPVAILQDLAGPKVRTGMIAGGSIDLASGATFTLTARDVPGDAQSVSLTYPELPKEVEPGDTLLLSDGALELSVLSTTAEEIVCRVVVGGPLGSHKGINLPTRSIRAPSLSEKDRADLAFGVAKGVDYIALSFVRSAEDIRMARALVREHGGDTPIIAKIEKHEALDCIDAIVAEVDGIMVARGDLGVEIPLERVPLVQKMLIAKANRAGKPVITATQMLRSMVESPRPTRAEVTDVANAIIDGTDAVMLSEETAMGAYPIEAVKMMARIADDAETGFRFEACRRRSEEAGISTLPEAVAHAACSLALDLKAPTILTCTQSGSTSRLVAKYRPPTVIVAATPLASTYRRLALVWGVVPVLVEKTADAEGMIAAAREAGKRAGLLKSGDTVVLTAGFPIGMAGTTNLIKAAVIA
jgi:pyruvate kinase